MAGYDCSHLYEECLGKAVGNKARQSFGEAIDTRRAELALTRQLGFSTMLLVTELLYRSHLLSRHRSRHMNHGQSRLRFMAALIIRSPACTPFLLRPQLLTRV